jgi:hypothetical protein
MARERPSQDLDPEEASSAEPHRGRGHLERELRSDNTLISDWMAVIAEAGGRRDR